MTEPASAMSKSNAYAAIIEEIFLSKYARPE